MAKKKELFELVKGKNYWVVVGTAEEPATQMEIETTKEMMSAIGKEFGVKFLVTSQNVKIQEKK